jgi:fatty acid CoA ligase FadD28
VFELSIPSVLRERASLQPDGTAFTFIDYEQDRAGLAESLTWTQLYRRTLNLVRELRECGSAGDRAVILAPPGLYYIVAFLGALQAGFIAVPLGGASHERVDSVLHDASPSVILTTSVVVSNITESVKTLSEATVPSIVEVDLLELDSRQECSASGDAGSDIAYLQYTSGSTRLPAGVMVTYRNLAVNFDQMMSDYFSGNGKVAPTDTTFVSWLPFYHDMGLIVGIWLPILAGLRAVVTSPASFLARPARWMQLLASNSQVFTAAPNFAFELATRKTSDADMAGLDLSDVHSILNGSERVQPATLNRFTERFARCGLRDTVIRPSYGLAEATVYVATHRQGQPPEAVHFESEKLSAGHATRCTNDDGTPLVSYGVPRSQTIRIVDPEARTECLAGAVGEIWVHGGNVATGYWRKPDETEHTFCARLVAPSAFTPEEPWLRTGDLGFFSDGELFIIGRIKDLLIVYGRNHSPDDIEGTIQEITRGRCAAIPVPHEGTEKLVAIIELKNRSDSHKGAIDKLAAVKLQVRSAILRSYGLGVADLVLVPPGSIPITTSGKVRRRACAEQYLQNHFTRLDSQAST